MRQPALFSKEFLSTLSLAFFVVFFGAGPNLIFSAQASTTTKEFIYTLTYSLDDLKFGKEKEGEFDTVALPEAIFMREVAKPQLPLKVIHFAIDSDKSISKIQIVADETVTVPGTFNIYPAQESQRLDQEPKFTPPDPSVYRSSKSFPGEKIQLKKKGFVSETELATFHVHPVEYIPAKKKLILHTKMVFKITLVSDLTKSSAKKATPHRSIKSKETMESWLSGLVANPKDVIAQYAANSTSENLIPATDPMAVTYGPPPATF